MDNSLKIGKKTFVSAVIILFILLIGAGILTQVVPMGSYKYEMVNGQSTIIPDSFSFTDGERLPIYKWFTAPIEVLFTSEGIIIIAIILFLLIIGGSIHILNKVNVLKTIIDSVALKFNDRKYLLIRLITLIFMALGAFIGIFEEIIPLIPLIIALSLALGFDVMTGLGMSLLATGFGFSAAVTNPFTIGIAQKIAGIPVFSGIGFRLIIFASTYLIISTLLVRYAKKIEKKPDESIKLGKKEFGKEEETKKESQKAVYWFLGCTGVMVLLILLSTVIPFLSSLNLPIIGVIFLIAGIGSGLLSSYSLKNVLKLFLKGTVTMLPGVVLILLATGVKHIIQSGMIMDTILYYASGKVLNATPFASVLMVYALVFVLNFFIGSGSAKAFIVIPIIAPLMDMIGVSRQLSILAFQFGDGFSNILYPTNAVLLIGIGLAGISYTKWFKWMLKYQIIVGLFSILFLWIGLKMGY